MNKELRISRNLKIYIASSFDFVEGIKTEVIPALQNELGDNLIITRDWWANNVDLQAKHDNTDFKSFLSHPFTRLLCECDFTAIDDSDIVIIYNPRVKKQLTGANIEAGYAWGKGKTVILFGWFKKSAMYSRGIPIDTISDLKKMIRLHIVGAEWHQDKGV